MSIRVIAFSFWLTLCGTSHGFHCILEGVVSPGKPSIRGLTTSSIQMVLLWYFASIRLYHNIQLQKGLDNVPKFASELKVNIENFNLAIVPLEHTLLNKKANDPLHLYSSAQKEKKQHINIMLKFVFYVIANWATMECVVKIQQNYTLMGKFLLLICTDCPIILFNSKNHREYIVKKL